MGQRERESDGRKTKQRQQNIKKTEQEFCGETKNDGMAGVILRDYWVCWFTIYVITMKNINENVEICSGSIAFNDADVQTE